MALGAIFGNFQEFLHVSDWQDSGAGDLVPFILFSTIGGTIFLLVAFALYRGKTWGPLAAALVSLTVLMLLLHSHSNDLDAMGSMLIGIPMVLVLLWSVSHLARVLRGRNVVVKG